MSCLLEDIESGLLRNGQFVERFEASTLTPRNL
jgi:hypothetical protein